MTDLPTANLNWVHRWKCPACQYENEVRGEPVPHEDMEQTLRACGELAPWEELPEGVGADAYVVPEQSKCDHCGAEVRLVDEGGFE